MLPNISRCRSTSTSAWCTIRGTPRQDIYRGVPRQCLGRGLTRYLNVEIDVLKDIAKRTLLDNEPVWFGCDVGKMLRRDTGIWDAQLFDYASVYDTAFTLNKADRLVYRQTQMTHAMLFTGVDIVDGTSRRWRVENWGEENGRKGSTS